MVMSNLDVVEYLLEGDPSIVYQTRKYLLGESEEELAGIRKRIPEEGFGKRFLDCQNEDKSFGGGVYMPKWTSTHYTLLDLRYLEIERETEQLNASVLDVALHHKARTGGIALSGNTKDSDVCVDGMFLNYASYFMLEEKHLESVVDFLIRSRLKDGGFNCRSTKQKVEHSSLHTTISVLEGIQEYLKWGYTYRKAELEKLVPKGKQFLLKHRLYKSDRTGTVINQNFLKPVYPPRWKYDILRALYYLCDSETPYDRRMEDALRIIEEKRKPDGTFPRGTQYAGDVHFHMETGRDNRWNTLRMMRVLQYYGRLFEEIDHPEKEIVLSEETETMES
jgi:hypothetical protein